MSISRTQFVCLGLTVVSFILAAALYHRLPESIPTHWNAKGEADGFTPKPWGPFVLPIVTACTYGVLLVVPRISPRGFRMARFARVFELIQLAIIAFLFGVNVLVLLAGIGADVPIARAIHVGVGLLLVVLGNFMGKLTKNYFIGIRTPWTLASDEVWLRTHRLGGKLSVVGGIIAIVMGALGGGTAPLLIAVALSGGVPAVYSYVLYRRIEGSRNGVPGSDPSTRPD